MENQKAQEARQDLILAIKKARKFGVNVGAVFYEVEAELKLLQYRLFGATLAGFFVCSAPIFIRLLDVFCVMYQTGVRMEYAAIDWLCLGIGVPSMLAFGWKLVKPVDKVDVDKLIPAIEDITDRMMALRDDDGTNGDV